MKISDFNPYLYGREDIGFQGLPIIDAGGRRIFFRPNKAQEYALERMKEQDGKPLRIVILKGRQVGFSTFFLCLMVSYAHRFENRECYVVAQLEKTAKILHERGLKMWETLYQRHIKKGTTKVINFPHDKDQYGNDVFSFIKNDTAGSLKGGRGPTAHALHLTEASRYPPDAISTLSSSVAYNEDSMILVETTANGKSGDGADYYHLWKSAREGRNEYLPIFISWLMDPSCSRPVDEKFTIIDVEEERLFHEDHLTLEQLNFRRSKIEGEFGGDEARFSQEYPLDENVAFISSGTPVFYFSELEAIRKDIVKPKIEGIFDLATNRFQKQKGGYIKIWEPPIPDMHYFIGGDAAQCADEESDFASCVGWNGEEATQSFRIAERLDPKAFAIVLNLIGRWYNRAMIAVEITGGYGNHVQMVLKDELHYPNLYIWKGRNDRVKLIKGAAYGWMTNVSSRNDLMSVFKHAIREEGLVIKDDAMLVQMENAEQELGLRWQVDMGHDDILMAAMIGWMARFQYPPPAWRGSKKKVLIDTHDVKNTEGYVSPDQAYMQKFSQGLMKLVKKDSRRMSVMSGSGPSSGPDGATPYKMKKKII